MPIFIWISEGPTGEDARPILASSDPAVIRQFLRVLERRICSQTKVSAAATAEE